MAIETDEGEVESPASIDDAGVDRAAIRAMLALSPLERLRWLEEFVGSILEIRERNGRPADR